MKEVNIVLDENLEADASAFGKLEKCEKVTIRMGATKLVFISSNKERKTYYKSYPKVKLVAQNRGYSLRDIAKGLRVSYQIFVNACNGRGKFKAEWKTAISKLLDVSEKELFEEE